MIEVIGGALAKEGIGKIVAAGYDKLIASKSLEEVYQRLTRPLLLSASDAQDRLWNLHEMATTSTNPVLLLKDETSPRDPWFPMTKHHYLVSTVYLICRFFCWVEIYRKQAEVVACAGGEVKTKELFERLYCVKQALAKTEGPIIDDSGAEVWSHAEDRPIFQMQQVYLGQSLITASAGVIGHACLDYVDFYKTYDTTFRQEPDFKAVEQLSVRAVLRRPTDFAFTRCCNFANELLKLIEHLDPARVYVKEHERRPLSSTEPVEGRKWLVRK